jgi:hypothetical protein
MATKHILCPTFRAADCNTDIRLGHILGKEINDANASRGVIRPHEAQGRRRQKKSIGLESHPALQTEKAHAIRQCGD